MLGVGIILVISGNNLTEGVALLARFGSIFELVGILLISLGLVYFFFLTFFALQNKEIQAKLD